VNSYEFHIGDYYRRTSHLSQVEHYIYRRLIDQYFLTELPITTEIRSISRTLQLTADQIETLEMILDEFFELEDDGWHHSHIKQELERIYGKSEQARDAANRRWDKAKKKKKANGSNADAMRTHSEPDADAMLPLDPLTPLPSNPKELSPTGFVPVATQAATCPHQKIVDSYHKNFPVGPKVKVITDKRKRSIKARWINGGNGLDFWDAYFTHAAKSRFLTGNNDRNWIADFDFFIRPDTATFMQEGKYHK